jgi:nicotinamide-nucleotide amidase
VRAEIISVGTELLLGQIVDTNAAYLSQVLSSIGIDICYRSTVGDNAARLADTLKTALSRSDVVITIGGLGPTEDDLTKETIADALGDEMVMDPESEAKIRGFFERRGLPIAESNLKQALRPKHGEVVPNDVGTAPGALFARDGKIVIALPGPPGEFIPMVDRYVTPILSERAAFVSGRSIIKSRVLRVCGIGESAAEQKVKDLLASGNPSLAPYAKGGEVHFRVTAKASSKDEAEHLIAGLESKVRERLGDLIYGIDEETLESVVVRMLIERKLTLGLAESCTGGLVANRITNVPGSSEAFIGGIVSYSNEAKMKFLGVPEETLRAHGAVSPETAEAMSEGAARNIGTDIALGITGIAGPGGATAEKPVGLVYIALKTPAGVEVTKNMYGGSREDIKMRASQTALNTLREWLMADG